MRPQDFGAAGTCIRNVCVLLNMQYFQNACFFRYLCSDYFIYKLIKLLKSNLLDVLYFVKNFLSSINWNKYFLRLLRSNVFKPQNGNELQTIIQWLNSYLLSYILSSVYDVFGQPVMNLSKQL